MTTYTPVVRFEDPNLTGWVPQSSLAQPATLGAAKITQELADYVAERRQQYGMMGMGGGQEPGWDVPEVGADALEYAANLYFADSEFAREFANRAGIDEQTLSARVGAISDEGQARRTSGFNPLQRVLHEVGEKTPELTTLALLVGTAIAGGVAAAGAGGGGASASAGAGAGGGGATTFPLAAGGPVTVTPLAGASGAAGAGAAATAAGAGGAASAADLGALISEGMGPQAIASAGETARNVLTAGVRQVTTAAGATQAARSGLLSRAGSFIKENKDLVGSVIGGVGTALAGEAAVRAERDLLQDRYNQVRSNYGTASPARSYRGLKPVTTGPTPTERFDYRDYGSFEYQFDPKVGRIVKVPAGQGA